MPKVIVKKNFPPVVDAPIKKTLKNNNVITTITKNIFDNLLLNLEIYMIINNVMYTALSNIKIGNVG